MSGRSHRGLRREITAVMAVKLLVLVCLWLGFVRGHEVRVDAERAAGLLGSPTQVRPGPGVK